MGPGNIAPSSAGACPGVSGEIPDSPGREHKPLDKQTLPPGLWDSTLRTNGCNPPDFGLKGIYTLDSKRYIPLPPRVYIPLTERGIYLYPTRYIYLCSKEVYTFTPKGIYTFDRRRYIPLMPKSGGLSRVVRGVVTKSPGGCVQKSGGLRSNLSAALLPPPRLAANNTIVGTAQS